MNTGHRASNLNGKTGRRVFITKRLLRSSSQGAGFFEWKEMIVQ